MPVDLDALIRTLGAWGYPGLGLAALIEYVFPPFPGDTVVVLGGAWAGQGERSILLVFLSLTLGSLVGMALTWRVGRGLVGTLREAPEGSRILGLRVGQIRKAQALMRERGGWMLVLNRFLPSFRTVIFLAAGAADVPLRRVLLLGTVSATAFNALLVGVGVAVGDNAAAIAEFFRTFRTASLTGVAFLALLFLARFLWRRARAQSRP